MPHDFERFERLLAKLSDVFGKALDADATQAYLRALRDVPIEEVERLADTHIRFSKFFPKPFELRPKEERPKEKDAAEEAAFRAREQARCRELDALHFSDPEEWLRQVRPAVWEKGKMRGMSDQEIELKLRTYAPWNGSATS